MVELLFKILIMSLNKYVRMFILSLSLFFFFFFFFFFGLHLEKFEVSGFWVELEVLLPAFLRRTTTLGWSCICDLHHSSGQHQILNALSEARD